MIDDIVIKVKAKQIKEQLDIVIGALRNISLYVGNSENFETCFDENLVELLRQVVIDYKIQIVDTHGNMCHDVSTMNEVIENFHYCVQEIRSELIKMTDDKDVGKALETVANNLERCTEDINAIKNISVECADRIDTVLSHGEYTDQICLVMK